MPARFAPNLRHRLLPVAAFTLISIATAPVQAAPVQAGPFEARTARAAAVQASSDDSGLTPPPDTSPAAAGGGLLTVPLPPPGPRLFAITPERRALLNTIRYAEGTWANGDEIGYRIMFGGGLMPHLERHPDRVVRTARYASAAAGAYQFMPFTWRMVSRALGFNHFGPQLQDQAAIFLIQRRGALDLADQGRFSPDLAHRLAPEWASFPTRAGRSFYGQPVKRLQDLQRFYDRNLAQLRTGLPQEPAPTPACEQTDLRCRLESLDRLGPRGRES